MQLMSEAWFKYWEGKHIEGLSDEMHREISAYDMKKFQFNLIEAYPEPDCDLRNFPSYQLTFFTPKDNRNESEEFEEITMSVSKDYQPVVKRNGQTYSFETYYNLSAIQASALSDAMEIFATDILSRYLRGELQLSD